MKRVSILLEGNDLFKKRYFKKNEKELLGPLSQRGGEDV